MPKGIRPKELVRIRCAAATGDSRSACPRPASISSPERKIFRKNCCASSQLRFLSSREARGPPMARFRIIYQHLHSWPWRSPRHRPPGRPQPPPAPPAGRPAPRPPGQSSIRRSGAAGRPDTGQLSAPLPAGICSTFSSTQIPQSSERMCSLVLLPGVRFTTSRARALSMAATGSMRSVSSLCRLDSFRSP